MRGFRAAKQDVGPSIARNLIYVWGSMLIVGILIIGGILTFVLAAVGLMNAGDWLLGRMVVTDFVTSYIMPAVMVLSFLGLVWLLYWRNRSDSSGI